MSDELALTRLPVTSIRIGADRSGVLSRSAWPMTLPCVRQLAMSGLEPGRLSVLIGENGSGKSTLVEAIAQAYGLSPEGGSTGARHSTRVSESPLYRALELRRGIGASRWGFFLRAETMHGFFTYRETTGSPTGEPEPERFHSLSHGESFLEVINSMFDGPGLYVLDEPESALSFTGCLALVGVLARMASSGNQQAIVATHSPVIAATPGARLLEIGPWGWVERQWQELDLVQNWRAFLDDPQLFLRYLLD